MNIARRNINELLRLGYQPNVLICLNDETYSIEEANFKAFADRKGWEKGLDYSIQDNVLDCHIVLQNRGVTTRRASPAPAAVPAACNCAYCRPPTVDQKISKLRSQVKTELRGIRSQTTNGQYCKVQLDLIKDVLLG
jgi:hypothetical protein